MLLTTQDEVQWKPVSETIIPPRTVHAATLYLVVTTSLHFGAKSRCADSGSTQ